MSDVQDLRHLLNTSLLAGADSRERMEMFRAHCVRQRLQGLISDSEFTNWIAALDRREAERGR
jgi:hypothetical protein